MSTLELERLEEWLTAERARGHVILDRLIQEYKRAPSIPLSGQIHKAMGVVEECSRVIGYLDSLRSPDPSLFQEGKPDDARELDTRPDM